MCACVCVCPCVYVCVCVYMQLFHHDDVSVVSQLYNIICILNVIVFFVVCVLHYIYLYMHACITVFMRV